LEKHIASIFRVKKQGKQKPAEAEVKLSFFHRNEIELSACLMQVSCLSYFSILKMEAISSVEISAEFHRTTRCYSAQHPVLGSTVVRASKPDNICDSYRLGYKFPDRLRGFSHHFKGLQG
jgi:hypothetical protein